VSAASRSRLLALAILLHAPDAPALDPSKALTQYVHDVWTSDQGLPQNGVAAVTRTSDGYLWIGTEEGMARFDGQRFQVFDSSAAAGLGGVSAGALLPDARRLWIGTRNGVWTGTGGSFAPLPLAAALPQGWTTALCADGKGGVWIATSPYGGLSHLKDGAMRTFTMRDGLSSDSVQSLARDRRGRLWIGTTAGLDLWDGVRFVRYTTRDGLAPGTVFAIVEDRAGTLWIGTKEGDPGSPGDKGALTSLRDGRFSTYATGAGGDSPGVQALLEDRDGNLWCGTFGGGLRRFAGGSFSEAPLLGSMTVAALHEDAEGSLWVGTDAAGLHRLRDGSFTTYGREEGLPDDVVESLYEDSSGALWIGTRWRGVLRRKGTAVTRISTREGLPNDRVNAVLESPAGVLWFGTAAGLVRLQDARLTTFTTGSAASADNVSALCAGDGGTIWAGTWDGLRRFAGGALERVPGTDALAGVLVSSLLRTRDGALWIGTARGVSRLAGGSLQSLVPGGGPVDVRALFEDGDGSVWIGTRGEGLHRFRDGRLARVTRKEGLHEDVVGTIGEDRLGYLWTSGSKGISRVSRRELVDVLEGRAAAFRSVAYGTADGMRSRECEPGQGQLRARDGRLWFATVRGAVSVDPAALTVNRVEPPVVIESASAGGKSFLPSSVPEISGGHGTLEVRYAGLSLLVPERVRYRYKLVGLSDEWVDAGARREAFIANIPPGRFTFLVTAANNDGTWSSKGARLSLVVLPSFRQTWWFRGLLAAAALGLAAVVHRARVSALQREKAEQEQLSRRFNDLQESERQRIACELHDSLGQSLVIIKNRARQALDSEPGGLAQREQLEEITESATEALAEVRQIAYDLRPFHIDRLGLTKAVDAMVRQVAGATGVKVTAALSDIDGVLPAGDEISFYRIVQEALGNAVKHAQATEIQVGIRREDGTVALTVRDNGRGFAPAPASAAPGAGGFGLVGMAERARILRGGLTIHSAPGEGTTIGLTVAGREHAG